MGIKAAERTASKVSSQIAFKEFDWNEWLPKEKQEALNLPTVAGMVENFETDVIHASMEVPAGM